MLLTALQELPFGPLKTEKIKSKIFTIHSRSFFNLVPQLFIILFLTQHL